MIAMLGEHRADDGDIVRVLRDAGQNFRERQAALAMLRKLERAAEQMRRAILIVRDFEKL